jgi:hypothetical protein
MLPALLTVPRTGAIGASEPLLAKLSDNFMTGITTIVEHYPLSSCAGNTSLRRGGRTNNGCDGPSYRDASC